MDNAKKYSSKRIQALKEKISPEQRIKVREKMILAGKISDFMVQRGYNKSGFAAALGKNPSEITKWLSGTHNFTHDTLVDIATLFDIKVYDLFKNTTEKTKQTINLIVNVSKQENNHKAPSSRLPKATSQNQWTTTQTR